MVDELTPGTDIWDAEVKGFGVRAQANSKAYVLKTAILGRQRWITIGRHGSPWTPDAARSEALRLLGEIVQGHDPTEDKFADKIRIDELCRRYLEQYAIPKKKASSVALDSKNIANHVIPLMGNKFADLIKSSDIEVFKNAVKAGKTAPKNPRLKRRQQGGGIVVRGGPGVANRCLTLLHTIFNVAERWGIRPKGSNPVKDVTRYREAPKERYLTGDEFLRLGSVLDQFEKDGLESIYAIAAIRLLTLSGARLSEVLTLRWEHVQLDRRRLRLPDSKTGAKTIELAAAAIELLKTIPRLADNPFVIVGRRHGCHLVDLQRPWQRIRKEAGLSDVRIHDLRHSFASLAIRNGVSIQVIGKLLGHRSSETTLRYAHLADSYVAAESEKIGNLLSSALGSKPTVADSN
ncbi:site-specific integrase [Bosea sp. PAMC 26642]|uniref:site-specific integrase n=1 Tax=Bosea sp. (strain PAMC 26642) TaxID=1792307 RepID=UPI00143C3B09|nr:site-specific integrase [Bosea sp. PAMC 26642]